MSSLSLQHLQRHTVARWTRVLQAAAAAAIAGAVGLGVVGLPSKAITAPPQTLVVAEPPSPTANTNANASAPGTLSGEDSAALATRLATIANHPKPVVIAPPPDIAPDPVPVTPVATLTYHGIVTFGPVKFGLIKKDGKQRFVTVGQKIDEAAVKEISPDKLVLEPDTVIELAQREGGVITRTGAGAQAGMPGQPGMNPQGSRMGGIPTISRQFAPGVPIAGMGKLQAGERYSAEGVRIPGYVQQQDEKAWRRARIELLRNGEFEGQDLDRMAYKMLGDRREEFSKETDLDPNDRELELEHERARLGDKGK